MIQHRNSLLRLLPLIGLLLASVLMLAAVASGTPVGNPYSDAIAAAADDVANIGESMMNPPSSDVVATAADDGRDKRQLGPLIGQLLGVGGGFYPGAAPGYGGFGYPGYYGGGGGGGYYGGYGGHGGHGGHHHHHHHGGHLGGGHGHGHHHHGG